MDTRTPPSDPAPRTRTTRTAAGVVELETLSPHRWGEDLREQLALPWGIGGLVRILLVPVQTRSVWYMLGGILGLTLALEVVTGIVLLIPYQPDAAHAYQSTAAMLRNPWWSIVLNLHYFGMYLIFGLVLLHFMRAFVTGTYRGMRNGLWQVGVVLGGLCFAVSLTGETLHWDERGLAIPWHIGEFLELIRLSDVFNYRPHNLLNLDFATTKLIQIYALHIVIIPLVLLGLMALHYRQFRRRGVSAPPGRGAGATAADDVRRSWLLWGGLILGALLVVSVVWQRSAGPAAQDVPISPFYHNRGTVDPGLLGTIPSIPISWTHGWNRFVTVAFHWRPDIWGTTLAITLMVGSLVLIPFVDRVRGERHGWRQVFDLRRRGLTLALVLVFWATLLIGVITDWVTPVG